MQTIHVSDRVLYDDASFGQGSRPFTAAWRGFLGNRLMAAAPVIALAIVLVITLSGCTQTPEWADPARMLDDDDGPQRVEEDLKDGTYPNLASVPDGPRRATSRKDRNEVAQSLESDFKTAAVVEGSAGAGPSPVGLGGGSELAAVVYFRPGSLRLDERDDLVLRGAAALQKKNGGRLRVIGHTSRQGDGSASGDAGAAQKADALRLSLERADQVAAALIAWGVDPNKISVEGRADSSPVYYESNPAGAAGNRRAEIFLGS